MLEASTPSHRVISGAKFVGSGGRVLGQGLEVERRGRVCAAHHRRYTVGALVRLARPLNTHININMNTFVQCRIAGSSRIQREKKAFQHRREGGNGSVNTKRVGEGQKMRAGHGKALSSWPTDNKNKITILLKSESSRQCSSRLERSMSHEKQTQGQSKIKFNIIFKFCIKKRHHKQSGHNIVHAAADYKNKLT